MKAEHAAMIGLWIRAYFVRDWEEVSGKQGNEILMPPEPDKFAGVASVINKKECPGKPAEGVLIVDATRVAPFGDIKKGGIAPGLRLKYLEITTATEVQKPKWLPQVLAKVEAQAAQRRRTALYGGPDCAGAGQACETG